MYEGGGVGSPLARKTEWFSFVGGDDIRASCAPNSPDRYRLVYNGFWREQVRIYELGMTAPRQLDQRVIGPADMTYVTTGDLLQPWRGVVAATALSGEQYDRLVAAFAESGVFGPPAVGLQMPSDSFYWTAAACAQGRFTFTAWLYPSDAFEKITFQKPLLELDGTTVAFNAPHPFDVMDISNQHRDMRQRWYLKVGPTGLVGG